MYLPFTQLLPYLRDVFGAEASSKASQIFLNTAAYVSKATDSLVLNLVLKNFQVVASSFSEIACREYPKFLSTIAERIKSKDVPHESKIALIGCARVGVNSLDKETAEKYLQKVIDLFEKTKAGKENLQSYMLIGSVYHLISKHNITSLDSEISRTCDSLVEAAHSKIELKLKKTLIEAFGPLIGLRASIGPNRLSQILDIIFNSLSLEALHFPCIFALESFSNTQKIESTNQLNQLVNNVIGKLVELFTAKNKLYQVGIVKVLDGFHKNEWILIREDNQLRIAQAFASVLEKCDNSIASIICNFLRTYFATYQKHGKDMNSAIDKMRQNLSNQNLEEEYLRTLVALYKMFTPADAYSKTVEKIFQSTKKDPHCDPYQSSLFLYFLFETVPEIEAEVKDILEEAVSGRATNFCLNLNLLGHLGYLKNYSKEEKLLAKLSDSIQSKEAKVKLAAIKCLAGLAVADLASFSSYFNAHIARSVENRMFFFQAVQVLFDHLSAKAPKDAPKQFLEYLSSFVEQVEQTERPELFKAIGKVVKKDSGLIEKAFKQWSESSKSIYRLLGASICRHLFDKTLDIDNFEQAKALLLNSIRDLDPEVEAAAFVSLDAIHYSYPKPIEKLLSMEFCNTMATKMLPNAALVDKIEMGVFSHRIDNGLPLRKACFSFLLRLSKSEVFNLHPFLDAVIKGVGEENEDIKFIATKLLKESVLGHGHTFLLVEFAQNLAASLEKSMKSFVLKIKTIMQEKGANFQALKGLLSLIHELARSSEFCNHPQFKALENEILASAELKEALNSN